MNTSFRSRHRRIGIVCAGIVSIAFVGLAVAASSGNARGGASIAVENRFTPASGLPYMAQKEPVQFTVDLSNSGGASPTGARLAFDVPKGLTEMSWSCSAEPPAECQISEGAGAIDQPLDTLLAGGEMVYTVFAQQLSSLPPYVEGTASVSLPVGAGAICSDGQTPPCRSSVRVPTGTNLSAVLVGERTGPGTARFTFTATHSASSRDADGTQVISAIPPGVSSYSWNCEADTSAASCPNGSGSGPINETIDFWGFGGNVTYTIDASMASGTSEEVSASVQLIPPKGGSCGAEASDPPCIAIEALPSAPHVTVSKTAELLGSEIGYTVVVANDGPGSASVIIDDPTPEGIDDLVDFQCTNTGSASCPSDPRLIGLETILPASSSLSFQFNGVLDAVDPQPSIFNRVTVDMVDGLCNEERSAPPCQATVVTGLLGSLRVEKSADATSAQPGQLINYEINIINESASNPADFLMVNDSVPEGISAFESWTCTSSVAGECPSASGTGDISEFVESISPGARLTYAVQARVDSLPPPLIENQVEVYREASGFICAPDGSQPPCHAESVIPALVTFEVSKTADKSDLSGGLLRYELMIRKLGPATSNVRVSDAIPPGLSAFTWTCEGEEIQCPQPAGNGAIDIVFGELPPGEVGFLIHVEAQVSGAPPAQIVNTLSVDAPADARCLTDAGLVPPPCLASATTQMAPLLSVAKTSAQTQLLRGGSVNYLVTVANEGASVVGVGIQDAMPAGLESMDWTCTAYLGVACPGFSGSGAINLTTGDFPPDSRLEFNVTGSVASDAPDMIVNVATITPPGATPCVPNGCSASVSLPVTATPAPNFLLALTTSATQAPPASTFSYTVDLRNVGMMSAKNLALLVPMPAGVDAMSWTCDGPQCPAASGSGAIAETIGQLGIYEPGSGEIPVTSGRLVYVIDASVSPQPPATIDLVASVVPSGPGGCVGGSCSSSLTLPTGGGAAVLDVGMSADRSQLQANGIVQYEIVLRNNSSGDAGSFSLVNPVPAGLGGFTWQCTAVNDASCEQDSGSGAINETLGGIAANSSITFRISANVSAAPPASIANTATVTPSPGTTCSPSCVASVTLPVAPTAVPDVVVSKYIDAGAGTALVPGQVIAWTIRATNSGVPTSAVVTLRDRLPANIRDASVTAGAGVSCSSATPAAGALLTCSLAAGFTGEREVRITATVVAADALGGLRNTVETSGSDQPRCDGCTVVNPVLAAEEADVALRNARAYTAAGIPGTLVDVVNLSPGAVSQVPVRLSPVSAQRLLATYASDCTASTGAGGIVNISCPSPPSTQGVNCSGSVCMIDRIQRNAAVTLFIALNPGATASLRAELPGDSNPDNDVVNLPVGAAP